MEDRSKQQSYTIEIFKKHSPDGRLTLFLENRNFYDHLTHVDPIDGIVSFDPKSVEGQQVHLLLTCGCRYGREDLDVLGLTLQKDLLIYTRRIWPTGPESSNMGVKNKTRSFRKRKEDPLIRKCIASVPTKVMQAQKCSTPGENTSSEHEDILTSNFLLTAVQRKLMAKLGEEGHAFRICLPSFAPSSVTIQPPEDETEKPCGVSYDLFAFIGKRLSDVNAMSCVSMVIRKLTRGPPIHLRPIQSSTVCSDDSSVCSCLGNVKMCASIDKILYYHGEEISVDLSIDNLSRCPIRRVRVSVVQVAELYMLTKGSFRSVVVKSDTPPNLPIRPGTTDWKHTFVLHPIHGQTNKKRGLVFDGLLKHEPTNLASSSVYKVPDTDCRYYQVMRSLFGDVVHTNAPRVIKENQGILISYLVHCQCWMGLSAFSVEIPFFLMHPTPEPERTVSETDTSIVKSASDTSLNKHISTVLVHNTLQPNSNEEGQQSSTTEDPTVLDTSNTS